MLDRFKAFLSPPEVKASRTAKLLAYESGGRARWTPRDYAALSREGYLSNAIVHRAVRLIAENAAACSFLVFDGAREIDAHPLSLLMTRPNPRQDGGALFEMLYAHLLLAGNAYVEAVAIDSSVRELYALRPDRMKVVPGDDGWAEAYDYSVGGRSVRFDQQALPVPPILHLTFYHPLDDHYGLAPIEAAAVALDSSIQISVRDLNRTSPPASPAEGERHVVATGAVGTWGGQDNAIATWQDGAWAFLVPRTGWCIWSAADNVLYVYDGLHWRDLRNLPVTLDNAAHVGVNTTATAPNLLSVKSNAALFAAMASADGGSGDVRVQLSKESAAKIASIVFADNFSGRAEFGLVGSDAFKLKVSADGAAWIEAFTIDQASGNLALPRGLALSGVVAPPVITANQNDYNPSGLASAVVMQVSSDAARNISGLGGGAEGRVVTVINVGGQPVTLLDESASSAAANRFTLGGNLVIGAKQAAILRYDGTATRWQALANGTGLRPSNNLSDIANAATARTNLGVDAATLTKSNDYTVAVSDYGALIKLTGSHILTFAAAAALGDKWKCVVRNTGTGIWTLRPSSAETINGVATCPLYPGESCTVMSDGTALQTLGKLDATRPAFLAYLSAAQTITPNTFAKVNFDTTLFDATGSFDGTNHRFVPNVAGYYQINCSISAYNSTSPTRLLIAIFKNGGQYNYASDLPVTSGTASSSGNALMYLNGSTDYVEIFVLIAATTAKIVSAVSVSQFSGAFVSAG